MEQHVIFLDTVHEILEQRLTELGFKCIDGYEWSLEETKTKLKDAFGIVIRSRFPMNADILAHAGELQFIARS
ncbi:MAG: phosphoglycerate dehydrogenase, partial [Flavobacteriia bacterium]|nr:phosphoglycerate dehydrogenase [Flavobacteriia bacterium]